jgi:hypothetical protein
MKKQPRSPRRLALKQEAIRTLTVHELGLVAAGGTQPVPFDRLTDSCVCGSTV